MVLGLPSQPCLRSPGSHVFPIAITAVALQAMNSIWFTRNTHTHTHMHTHTHSLSHTHAGHQQHLVHQHLELPGLLQGLLQWEGALISFGTTDTIGGSDQGVALVLCLPACLPA